MIKHFCDICNKEIIDLHDDLYELIENDFPFSTYEDSHKFLGKELCKKCYYQRLGKHIALDLELFKTILDIEENK